MNYIVSWDKDKYEKNIKKHGISFIDAATVFDDPKVVYKYDEHHSDDEDRFLAIGISASTNLLTVCHCYREDDTVVRIISARKANKEETEEYIGG